MPDMSRPPVFREGSLFDHRARKGLKSIAFALSLLLAPTAFSVPHQRRASESSEGLADCPTACQAQFKEEFYLKFNLIYDNDYFEVPIDRIVLSSKANITMLCNIIEKRNNCERRKCGVDPDDVATETEICEEGAIKENLACLRHTSSDVHTHCARLCRHLNYPMTEEEKALTGRSGVEQNNRCLFTECHRLCHKAVIKKVCPRGRTNAIKAVDRYYEEFLLEELDDVNDNPKTFTSFCRRITNGQNESEYVSTASAHNTEILLAMKKSIKEVLQRRSTTR